MLDLTRLTSRASSVLTGVDRVERAYLSGLLADDVPLFGLVRTPIGYLLLDRAALTDFDRALDGPFDGALVGTSDGGQWEAPRLIDRLIRRRDPARAKVEGFLRRRAIGRARARGLGRLLRRHMSGDLSYVNVGQTSLRAEVVQALRALARQDNGKLRARIAVMIHDTIPLDHPEWQRPGTSEQLAKRLRLAGAGADLILTNSQLVADDCARHLAAFGLPAPAILAAHLGVETPDPGRADLPAAPYFVCVNTIEPRKNHALLLDVWQMLASELGPTTPQLLVIGNRGWMNDAVLARLDAGPVGVTTVSGLDDQAIAALVAGARASLNPTLAEGFGLPAVEALALGTPVVCGDLAIWREVLGDAAVYLDPHDRYMWKNTVERLIRSPKVAPPYRAATWDDHFKAVLSAV